MNLKFSPQESNGQADSSPGTVVNGHSVSNNNAKTTHVPVSHSRNSSDSSGYHEASVLSESPAEGNQMTEKYVHYPITVSHLENSKDDQPEEYLLLGYDAV
jgi:hypothetical protein